MTSAPSRIAASVWSSAIRCRHARKFVRSVAKKNELLTQSSSCCVSALFSTICTVHYERDESGWWVAQVKEVPAAITQGRTIVESRRRIREALALALDNDRKAAKARLVDDVKLPTDARRALVRARLDRRRLEADTARA